ncbi:MAG: ATP-binding cassette domain-containing protein [Planctomycetes bacterium]|nr:ATP-binding cassette domain-containing protein [Planctomycetota bacterium]
MSAALTLRTVSLPERGLSSLSLSIARGARLALLGESGGGKSSLLQLANRLLEPSEGTVEVLGRAAREWPIAELRRSAVLVTQTPALFGGSVADELVLPLGWWSRARPEPAVLRAALEVAGLPTVDLEHPSAELSGGERTRLCLARAVLLAPPLLLLDEPTGALDVRTARELLTRLRAWAADAQITLVCVTHRPEDVEALGADVAYLLGGRLHGPFANAAACEDEAVGAFLGTLASPGESA